MTFSTKYSLKTVLSAISETEPRTYQQIADKVGCSRETVRNILTDYEISCKSKELKGEFIEWKIKKEKVGHTYNVLKEKQLTEDEVREKEIGELKRLMEKYPEVINECKACNPLCEGDCNDCEQELINSRGHSEGE